MNPYREPSPPVARMTAPVPRWRRAAMVGIGIGISVFAFYTADAERRAVSRIPEATRHEVFGRLRSNFDHLCRPTPPSAFRERCRADAAFMRNFPECDARCRSDLYHIVDRPTR